MPTSSTPDPITGGQTGNRRVDPQLPAIFIAAYVAVIALTFAVTVSLDLSLWMFGAALTVAEVLLFAVTRRLVLARAE